MAVARCAGCGSPGRKSGAYRLAVEPHGGGDSGIICGVAGCERPALIWLTSWEAIEYRNGRRIISLSGRAPKIRLSEVPQAGKHEAEPGDILPPSGATSSGLALLRRPMLSQT